MHNVLVYYYQNDEQITHILHTTGGFRWFLVNIVFVLLCINVLL